MWDLRKVGGKMGVPHQTKGSKHTQEGVFQTQVDIISFALPEHNKKREPGNMRRHTATIAILALNSVLNS